MFHSTYTYKYTKTFIYMYAKLRNKTRPRAMVRSVKGLRGNERSCPSWLCLSPTRRMVKMMSLYTRLYRGKPNEMNNLHILSTRRGEIPGITAPLFIIKYFCMSRKIHKFLTWMLFQYENILYQYLQHITILYMYVLMSWHSSKCNPSLFRSGSHRLLGHASIIISLKGAL